MAFVIVNYPKGKFDLEYYNTKHMPLMFSKWGSAGVTSWKVVKFDETAEVGHAALIFFDKPESIDAAMKLPGTAEVMADAVNYTDVKPVISRGILAAES